MKKPFSYPAPLLICTHYTEYCYNFLESSSWAQRGKSLLWPRADRSRREREQLRRFGYDCLILCQHWPQRQSVLEQLSGCSNLHKMTMVLSQPDGIFLEYSSTQVPSSPTSGFLILWAVTVKIQDHANLMSTEHSLLLGNFHLARYNGIPEAQRGQQYGTESVPGYFWSIILLTHQLRKSSQLKRALLWCHIVVIPQVYSTLCSGTQCHWHISKWEVTVRSTSAKKSDKIQISWC